MNAQEGRPCGRYFCSAEERVNQPAGRRHAADGEGRADDGTALHRRAAASAWADHTGAMQPGSCTPRRWWPVVTRYLFGSTVGALPAQTLAVATRSGSACCSRHRRGGRDRAALGVYQTSDRCRVWDHRRGAPKTEPTIGETQAPLAAATTPYNRSRHSKSASDASLNGPETRPRKIR